MEYNAKKYFGDGDGWSAIAAVIWAEKGYILVWHSIPIQSVPKYLSYSPVQIKRDI
jgi:hypothetical protein